VNNQRWKDRIKQLKEYKKKHGHCSMPFKYKPDQSLAHWVHGCRREYKLYQDGKPSDMTPQRIAELEKLGFVWKSDFPRKFKKERKRVPTEMEDWENCYQLLASFHAKYGHCQVNKRELSVPQKNKLCYFVSWQRKQYKLFKEGKPSHLTQKRVDRLSELGFDFNPNAKKRTDEENFDECYILLRDFVTEHGHCKVGMDRGRLGGPRLTKFVAWQRKQYVLFQKGKESELTQDKINMLEGLGLTWESRLANTI